MPQPDTYDRRGFLRRGAMAVAAAQLGAWGESASAVAKGTNGTVPALRPGARSSFAAYKQIDAGVLSIGYAQDGPAEGPAVGAARRSRLPWTLGAAGFLALAVAAAGLLVVGIESGLL